MYEELVKRLKIAAEWAGKGFCITPSLCLEAADAIEELSKERKAGKWIIKDNPGTGWYRVTCSACGEDVTSTAPVIGFFPNAKITWNYCPECGSYNGGDDDV